MRDIALESTPEFLAHPEIRCATPLPMQMRVDERGLCNGSVLSPVCPDVQQLLRRAAGLLLSALQAGHIDRQRPAPAPSSKCAQYRVDSRDGEALNTDLYLRRHDMDLLS